MKIHKTTTPSGLAVEYWYDPSVRVWYAITVDSKGNQIGSTLDSAQKSSLLSMIQRGFMCNPE